MANNNNFSTNPAGVIGGGRHSSNASSSPPNNNGNNQSIMSDPLNPHGAIGQRRAFTDPSPPGFNSTSGSVSASRAPPPPSAVPNNAPPAPIGTKPGTFDDIDNFQSLSLNSPGAPQNPAPSHVIPSNNSSFGVPNSNSSPNSLFQTSVSNNTHQHNTTSTQQSNTNYDSSSQNQASLNNTFMPIDSNRPQNHQTGGPGPSGGYPSQPQNPPFMISLLKTEKGQTDNLEWHKQPKSKKKLKRLELAKNY